MAWDAAIALLKVILGLGPRTQRAAYSIFAALPCNLSLFDAVKCYWVYILASRPRGTLYIGVTNNLLGRVENHRSGTGSKFTAKYRVCKLVWFEQFASIETAIQREKSLKRYLRAWKISLIEGTNPQWLDLYTSLQTRFGVPQPGNSPSRPPDPKPLPSAKGNQAVGSE